MIKKRNKLNLYTLVLLIGFSICVGIIGCGDQGVSIPRPEPDLTAATFGDISVSVRDVLIALQENRDFTHFNVFDATQTFSVFETLIDEIAFYKYLAQKARDEGLHKEESFKEFHEKVVNEELYQKVLIEEVLQKIEIGEADRRRFYEENKTNLFMDKNNSDVYMLRAIYVHADREGRTEEDAWAIMDKAYQRLEKGESFESVAVDYSEAPTVPFDKRGKVAPYTPSQIPLEIEQRLSQLKDGEYTEPFKYGSRIYIYMRDEYIEPKYHSYEDVKAVVADKLYKEKRSQGIFLLSRELQKKHNAQVATKMLTDQDIGSATSTLLSVPGVYEITLAEFKKLAEENDKNTVNEQQDFLNYLMNKNVFLAEALERKYTEEDVALSVAYYDRKQLASDYIRYHYGGKDAISEERIRQTYEQYKDGPELKTKDKYELYHLAFDVGYTPNIHRSELLGRSMRARRLAQMARDALGNGVSFDEVVAKYTQDRNMNAKGGLLGNLTISQMPPEVKAVVSNLKAGEISKAENIQNLINNRFAYEIFYVKDIEPGRMRTFEEARPLIERHWQNTLFNSAREELENEFNSTHTKKLDDEAIYKMIDYVNYLAEHVEWQADIARYEQVGIK